MAGSVRPIESYEGAQNGMSRGELDDELERLRNENMRLELSAYKFEEICVEVAWLAKTLREERWPLCTKLRMVRGLEAIIFKSARG